MFGPLSPIQFRLDGPGCDEAAAERFVSEISGFGNYREPELAPDQLGGLRMLAAKLEDESWLRELARKSPECCGRELG